MGVVVRLMAIVGLVLACAATAACSRSALSTQGRARGGGAAGGAGGAITTGPGGGGSAPERPVCRYQPAGEPVVAVTYADRHAIFASQIALHRGSEDGPAEIAIQVLASGGNNPAHPVNEVERLTIGQPWPDGVIAQSPFAVGAESHSYAQFARSSGAGDAMAMSWYSDLGGYGRVAFRTVDIASNALGPIVDIDLEGQVALALAPGAGVGRFGVGHAGDGYALIWRHYDQAADLQQAQVGIVDTGGQLMLGPHGVTPMMEPAPSPAAVWTGSAYVMATAYQQCPASELCAEQALQITRFRPASGDAFDDSGIDVVATLLPQSFEHIAARPVLAHHAGRTWLVWTEASIQLPGPERRIFLVELAPDGAPLSAPKIIAESIAPINRPGLVASDQGIALIWQELTGDDGPPDQPGFAAIRVLALDRDGIPLADPVEVFTTQQQGGIPSGAIVNEPRALLVTWSGARIGGGLDQTYLARFDCLPVQ